MGGGSGGSSWTPSSSGQGPAEESEEFDCSDVAISTRLQSPNPDVLDKIEEGDTLQIQIAEADEDEDTPALVAVYEGNYAGSVSHYSFQDLLECIQGGHAYEAEVTNVDGGLCQVVISHV